MPMDERRFFQWASLVPIAVPAGAALFWKLMGPNPHDGSSTDVAVSMAGILGWVGAVGAIPYVLFLLVLHLWIRPTSDRQWRVTLWLAPLAVATAASLAVGVRAAWPDRGWSIVFGGAYLFGLAAFPTAYLWVVIIWLTYRVARDRRWIVSTDPA